MMQAVVFEGFGGPEVLTYRTVPQPTAGAGEVLLRVRAVALSRLDLQTRSGQLAVVPLPHIGGCEIAGEVAEVGTGVTEVQVGQSVVVAPALDSGAIVGVQRDGGFAEFVAVPAACLVPIPDGTTFDEAAAVALTTTTAWRALVTKAGIHPGETVLVQSAGGGIGSAAIGIAKLWGAQVIATASSAEKLARAAALGADMLIHDAAGDWAAEVRRLTGGRGAEIVVEHGGAATWAASCACVAPAGRIVVCGATTGAVATLDLRDLYAREIMVLGAAGGGKADLTEVLRLVNDGRLDATIDSTFALADTRAAQERLAARLQFGKIIVQP